MDSALYLMMMGGGLGHEGLAQSLFREDWGVLESNRHAPESDSQPKCICFIEEISVGYPCNQLQAAI